MNIICPFLPNSDQTIVAADAKVMGDDRGEAFYRFRLHYAQSKWLDGLPAQAILQVNRAMGADLVGDEAVLAEFPVPYAAMAWLLKQRPDLHGQFLGNPRRHWQHYATRMSGERAEIRTWRAWACWWLAGEILPADEFPEDQKQIDEEGIQLPTREEIREKLELLGIPGEVGAWEAALVVS